VLPHIVGQCGVTLNYLFGCAKHKRRKNIEIESKKLPKISGCIATKVSPADAYYANKDISVETAAGGMNSPLDGIYARHVLLW